jgi:DNA-binding HxlR family transcriptional regulator
MLTRQMFSRVRDKWTALVIGILERGTVRFAEIEAAQRQFDNAKNVIEDE